MRAVDTNVLVRLITRDDPQQAASAEMFIQDGAWVSVLALAEAVWVLATIYGLKVNELVHAIDMLLNHQTLVLQDADTIRAALDLYRTKPGLGFSDCLILHLARDAGHLPLGTFDRGLAKAAGAQKL